MTRHAAEALKSGSPRKRPSILVPSLAYSNYVALWAGRRDYVSNPRRVRSPTVSRWIKQTAYSQGLSLRTLSRVAVIGFHGSFVSEHQATTVADQASRDCWMQRPMKYRLQAILSSDFLHSCQPDVTPLAYGEVRLIPAGSEVNMYHVQPRALRRHKIAANQAPQPP